MSLFSVLVDISARTASLEQGMKRAVAELEGFGRTVNRVKSLTEVAFAGFSARGLIEGVVSATERIDEMGKEAIKAGVAVEGFQTLAFAAKMAGVDVEALGNAFKFMNKTIGSDGGEDKLAKLGVNFQVIKNMAPDKQFVIIAEALSRITNESERAARGTEIMGKGYQNVKPLIAEGATGIEKLRQQIVDMDAVLTSEQVQAATKAAESIKKLETAWGALWNTLAVKAGPALAATADGLRGLFGGTSHSEELTRKAASIRDFLAGFKTPESQKSTMFAGYVAELKKVEDELDALRGKAAAAKAATDADIAAALKVVKPFDIDSLLFDKSSISRLKENESALDAYYQAVIDRQRDAGDKDRTQYATDMAENDALYAEKRKTLEDYQARWHEIQDQGLTEIKVHHTMIQKQFVDHYDFLQQASEKAAQSMQQAFATFFFDPFKGGISGMLVSFVDAIRRMIAEVASSKLMESLGFGAKGNAPTGFAESLLGGVGSLFGQGPGGGYTADSTITGGNANASTNAAISSGASSVLGSLIGGMFAGGGDPPVGVPSMVGEKGPELFVPHEPGTIVPSGGGGGINISQSHTFNIDSRSDRGQIQNDINNALVQSNKALIGTITRFNPGLRM